MSGEFPKNTPSPARSFFRTTHICEYCNYAIPGAAELIAERDRYKAALELIATPKRPDGTYNRCRYACEQLASEALK